MPFKRLRRWETISAGLSWSERQSQRCLEVPSDPNLLSEYKRISFFRQWYRHTGHFLSYMESLCANIFGFVETKIDCRRPDARTLLHKAKNKVWEHSKITTSSSSCTWNSLYKPGGTLLDITGPLVGRVRKSIDDDLGHWTGVELLGRDGRTIAVICAYQVCQNQSTSGSRKHTTNRYLSFANAGY